MRWRLLLAIPAVALLAFVLTALVEADRTPLVRHARFALPDWPSGARPVRVLLASDLHLGNVSMRESRLDRVVATIEAQHADLIVLAGDYVAAETPSAAAAIAPLLAATVRRLHAPLGVVAVMGNHDHNADVAVLRRALAAGGATILDNDAVRRDPLAIGGVDDMVTDHDDEPATVARLRALPGAKLMVSHAPNAIYTLPPDIGLVLAGHTHCGQVVLPLIGAPWELSEPRYRCGIVGRGDQRTVVSAGVGTSMLPLRSGAPPDIWVLTLGP